MSDRVKLQWNVPSQAWERFRSHVEDECGCLKGHLGRFAEKAMLEFCESDDLAAAEDKIDRLVRAAGRTPDTAIKKKNSLSEQSRTRVTVRVPSWVKEEFSKQVSKSDRFRWEGVALAHACNVYRDGGRAGRMNDKLDRILEDAESLLQHVADDPEATDTETEKAGLKKRNTIAVVNELPEDDAGAVQDPIHDNDLRDTIERVTGNESKPTIDSYVERVIDRLDYEPHPNNDVLWTSRENAEAQAGEGVPAAIRRPMDHISADEQVQRLRLEVGRKAWLKSSGSFSVKIEEVHETIFGGEIARNTAKKRMRTAAEMPGFDIGESNGGDLILTLSAHGVTADHKDFAEAVVEYRDADGKTLLEDTNTSIDDFTDDMEAAFNATPARADGGELQD